MKGMRDKVMALLHAPLTLHKDSTSAGLMAAPCMGAQQAENLSRPANLHTCSEAAIVCVKMSISDPVC